jgi:hypothetical protein
VISQYQPRRERDKGGSKFYPCSRYDSVYNLTRGLPLKFGARLAQVDNSSLGHLFPGKVLGVRILTLQEKQRIWEVWELKTMIIQLA